MSHRKSSTKHLRRPSSNNKPKNALPSLGSWRFTAGLLDMRDMALRLSKDPRVGPTDFWKLMEPLDTTKSVWKRLNRSDMEALATEDRAIFLSRYIAACTTAMARVPGILEAFERSSLVFFEKNASRGLEGLTGKSARYLADMKVLSPLSGEIPGFNGEFLGILHARLETLLKVKRLLPGADRGEEDLKFRIMRAQDKINAVRLYAETRAATAGYLRKAYIGDNPDVVQVLSTNGAPFVFMWAMSLNFIDDMIDGLLRGAPMMKATGASDKTGTSNFMATDDGIDAGLFRIERGED